MRYARELDEPRASLADYGEIRLIRGAILNSWEKYGVHIVDAVLGMVRSRPVYATSNAAPHASFSVAMDDGSLFQIDALGDVGRCFRLDLFGSNKMSAHEITDNFSMFRRLLWHFIESIRSGAPPLDPEDTLTSMRLLIAGRLAKAEQRKVFLDEIII
jgi:predicted dehydrogenase